MPERLIPVERGVDNPALRSTVSRTRGGTGHPLTMLDGWPPAVVHLVAAALTAAATAADLATGPAVSSSIFYLIPIALVAWRLGRGWGLAWASAAALLRLAADLAAGANSPLVHYWNAAAGLTIFLIIAAALASIRRSWDAERMLVGTDHLTGVLNGRGFHELIEMERSRTLRYNRPFTLAYMDVDGFRRVNEDHGRARGDAALQLIADTVRDNIRTMDAVARLGGDEFGLLLPETGTGAADVALRKIQQALCDATARDGVPLQFSIGAVVCLGPPESVDRLIDRAAALMYTMKQSGRNRIRTAALDENYGIEAILRRS